MPSKQVGIIVPERSKEIKDDAIPDYLSEFRQLRMEKNTLPWGKESKVRI